jgi:GTP cyclohydrolase I
MEDVQNLPDGRRIDIDQVGVSELRYPIVELDRERQTQHTVAQIAMSVSCRTTSRGRT